MKTEAEQIAEYLPTIPTLPLDTLTHHYKIASYRSAKLYKPILSAIEKELKARRKTQLPEEPTDEPTE